MQQTAPDSGQGHATPPLVRFGVFEVDLHTEEIRKGNKKIRLEGQPFRVLKILLERPGSLVTRKELQELLWPADTFVDFEVGINAAVKRLRSALDDSAETPRYVETLPRRGYRFIHPLSGVDDAAGADSSAAAAPVSLSPNAAPRGEWGTTIAVLSIIVLLAGASIALNAPAYREWLRARQKREPLKDAVALYVKGRDYPIQSVEDHWKRIDYFRRATVIDASYAEPWQGIAESYLRLGLSSQLPPDVAFPEAEQAVSKALVRDDTLAEAHMSLAEVNYMYKRDWDKTLEEIGHARKLDPEKVGINYLLFLGRWDEAVRGFELAVERDPITPAPSRSLANAYVVSRQAPKAVDLLNNLLRLDSESAETHILLAMALAATNDFEGAATQCDTGLSKETGRNPQAALGNCGSIYGMAGLPTKAQEMLDRIEALGPALWKDPLHKARIYDGMGDISRAMEFFEKAYDERSPWMFTLPLHPNLSRPLRDDSRFIKLLRKLHMPTVTQVPGVIRPPSR